MEFKEPIGCQGRPELSVSILEALKNIPFKEPLSMAGIKKHMEISWKQYDMIL